MNTKQRQRAISIILSILSVLSSSGFPRETNFRKPIVVNLKFILFVKIINARIIGVNLGLNERNHLVFDMI